MFCEKCGTKNDDDAVFCQKCGTKLKTETFDTKTILIVILIAIVIIVSAVGIYSVMNSNNDTSSNKDEGYNQNVIPEATNYEPTWHNIGSYGGVSDYYIPVHISGSNMKIEFSAFPIKNYADNDMTVQVYKNGNYLGSANVEWDGNDAVATRSNSLEFSGPGNYQIYVSGYELVSWNLEIYELS